MLPGRGAGWEGTVGGAAETVAPKGERVGGDGWAGQLASLRAAGKPPRTLRLILRGAAKTRVGRSGLLGASIGRGGSRRMMRVGGRQYAHAAAAKGEWLGGVG